MTIENRLKELQIELPTPTKAVANYIPWHRVGNLVFISGQITMLNGEILHKGQLGKDISVEEGQKAARLCAINLITQLKDACQGDLERLEQVIQLQGFVNATPEFTDHPKVINGASDLMVEVFGEKGRHTRAAVGSPSLPLGVSVEIAGIFKIS